MSLATTKSSEQLEALKILYANTSHGLVISIFVSIIIVFGLNFKVDQSITLGKSVWLCTILFTLWLRYLDALYFKTKIRKPEPVNIKYHQCRFSSGCIITACLWAIFAIVFYDASNILETTVITIILSALAGGSVNVLSGHRFTAIIYSAILLIPYSTFLLFTELYYLQVLGVLGLSFSFVMIASANKSARFTLHSIRLQNQNEHLLQEMERKVEQRTEQISRLSNTDPLTSMPNRKAFLSKSQQYIIDNPTKSFALFFIDLDMFKQINDTLGHQVGDRVLKETAKRIENASLSVPCKCRWGGDEFLLLMPYQNQEHCSLLARQLIATISKPHPQLGDHDWLSATIGVAVYPQHTNDLSNLIQFADIAMYHQKRKEKGGVAYFDDSLQHTLDRELLLSTRLKTAGDENALRLVFQPIVNSQTHHISSFEALLRWQLDGQPISPDEFIAIAEQYGIINDLGLWVFEQACQYVIDFKLVERKLTMSVNVSVMQLQDKRFITKLRSLLTKYQLSPSVFHLEVTESIFAADKAHFANTIKTLQENNFVISIDDFGTGYSSLSNMLDIGVDIVKIDKSFVQNMDKRGLSVINAVVNIAESLKFTTVAEGVETQEQANTLTEIGVTHLQGYYFAKPLEVEEVHSKLAS
ncbi:EAL domain-containing protein [Pseudoalteromonas sp. MMG010]|uniref:putative bifunctional diguanylate cyclase/phosphodiesterase n=1 Tax=Pseudoalteromonas sp. MMG010 TaxID=2822685 RepID=UPI001B39E8FE|nr:GGDEF domain-containing phosphodiesterase [Pseudoalteromonas sp. MMG010]MBQ4833121.1 EAL domain-containing protein [Pseudoalteromonas sp. MMG010]